MQFKRAKVCAAKPVSVIARPRSSATVDFVACLKQGSVERYGQYDLARASLRAQKYARKRQSGKARRLSAGAGAGAGCRAPLVVPGAGAVSWLRCACWCSWLCTWWRQVLVLVLGAGRRCWAPVLGVETGCRWVRAVSWLRAWWRRGAGAGWVLGGGAGAVSWLYARNIIRCRRLSVLCLLVLQGADRCQGCWCCELAVHVLETLVAVRRYGCRSAAYFCARKLMVETGCFKLVPGALDTAWPCANDTYGLCCLRAYFCAHKLNLFRARSYVDIPCCARGGDRVPVLGAVAGCWVCVVGAGAGCCQLAVRVVETGRRVLAVRVWCCELACRCWVLVGCCQVAGARCVCVVQIGCWCRVLALAVRVVETRHAVLRVRIGAAANAGRSPKNIFCMLLLSGCMLE